MQVNRKPCKLLGCSAVHCAGSLAVILLSQLGVEYSLQLVSSLQYPMPQISQDILKGPILSSQSLLSSEVVLLFGWFSVHLKGLDEVFLDVEKEFGAFTWTYFGTTTGIQRWEISGQFFGPVCFADSVSCAVGCYLFSPSPSLSLYIHMVQQM